MPLPTYTINAVNLGQREVIGRHKGEPVESCIRKRPVDPTQTSEIKLTDIGLEGDCQVDTFIPEGKTDQRHGGPGKAIYAYSQADMDAWAADWSIPVRPGMFGENLTIAGFELTNCFVGDVWAWGDSLLRVTEPRQPCFKLALATGKRGSLKQMWRNGRCGTYLSVIQIGMVPTTGLIEVVERVESALSIPEVFALKRAKNAPGVST